MFVYADFGQIFSKFRNNNCAIRAVAYARLRSRGVIRDLSTFFVTLNDVNRWLRKACPELYKSAQLRAQTLNIFPLFPKFTAIFLTMSLKIYDT